MVRREAPTAALLENAQGRVSCWKHMQQCPNSRPTQEIRPPGRWGHSKRNEVHMRFNGAQCPVTPRPSDLSSKSSLTQAPAAPAALLTWASCCSDALLELSLAVTRASLNKALAACNAVTWQHQQQHQQHHHHHQRQQARSGTGAFQDVARNARSNMTAELRTIETAVRATARWLQVVWS